MKDFFTNFNLQSLLWLLATIACYIVSRKIGAFKAFKYFPPILIAAAILIFFLEISNSNYEAYANGTSILTYILGPATCALAYPLYKHTGLIKTNLTPILIATFISVFVSIFTLYVFAKIFALENQIAVSLMPKCVTTPVALEITKMTNGILGLSIVGVFISGILGASIGHTLLKLCKVNDDISIGLAMGAVSHVIGTAKCLEVSQKQGTMAALVMVLTALFTTFFFFLIY